MKLKSALKSLPQEDLREINAFWGLPEPETPPELEGWVDHLYPRLQNANHFNQALEKLPDFQRNLIYFFAIHGGNLGEKELRRRCFTKNSLKPGEEPPPNMKECLDDLGRKGFLFQEKWADPIASNGKKIKVYGLPEPFLKTLHLPHVWQGYLGALLRQMATDQLNRLASEGLKIRVPSNKRDVLIYAIREYLMEPQFLQKHIDKLADDQREVLHLILQRRGVCLYRELMDILQQRASNLFRGETVEELLHHSCLLFMVTNNPVKYDNLLRVPRDLYYMIIHHHVRDNRPLADLDSINQVDEKKPPKTILDNNTSILRDLVVFVGYVTRHGVRRLGNGGIGKNDLKKILTRLSANKTLKYAQFLAWYAIQRNILVPTGEGWAISGQWEEWLEDSRSLYLNIASEWLDTRAWNEEYLDGDCVHSDHPPSNLIQIQELRKLVLENLAKIPFETWMDGPRFIESLLAQIEVRIPHRGGKSGLDKWNRINYLVIESILCENLYWLGLLSLGLPEKADYRQLGNRTQVTGENGHADSHRLDRHFNFNPRPLLPETFQFHFRLTPLGRTIIVEQGGQPQKLLDTKAEVNLPFRDDMLHFSVLPNLDVVAPPDLNLARFFRLRQFARIRHMDVMSLLCITKDSLRAGMDRGLTGEEILTFLQESCPSGLPETVKHLIRDCSNRYGEITIGYGGGYMRVEDPTLAQNLLANKSIRPFIKDHLDENILLLENDADLSHLSRELKKLNFMPTLENDHLCKTSDGKLHFSLSEEEVGTLMAALHFINHLEKNWGEAFTEERARSLIHALRPVTRTHLNISQFAEVMAKNIVRRFEALEEKKMNAVAKKYRRQMREFLDQRPEEKGRSASATPEAATDKKNIRKLLEYAIEQGFSVQLRYTNSSQEENEEQVSPESLNGDKLFAFCEEQQTYCAYRINRILRAELA